MNNTTTQAAEASAKNRFLAWLEDPMGGVIAASVATIGSFGIVVGGIWAINLAV